VVPVIDMLSTRPQLLLINLALLAPFGFLLQLRWPALGIHGVSLVSLVFAFVIETAQLSHPMRGTNVDDVLLNVLGAVAAGGLAMSIKQLGRSSRMTTSLR
jgi:glycopeptide antibiotics resistance protein